MKDKTWANDMKDKTLAKYMKDETLAKDLKDKTWANDTKGKAWATDLKDKTWAKDMKDKAWATDLKDKTWAKDMKDKTWAKDMKDQIVSERILNNAMPDFMLIGSNAFDHKKVHNFLDHSGDVTWTLAAVVQEADEDEVSLNDDYSIGCADLPQHRNEWHIMRTFS